MNIQEKYINMEYKSQYGQDKFIIENVFDFMTHGYFVDIGAGDGDVISNTYVMEKELNWTGVCIEPSSVSFQKLLNNRSCICDDTLIYSSKGSIHYYDIQDTGYYNEYFSSINKPSEHFKDYNLVQKKCDTLFNVLNGINAPTLIHYLSIDTEGSEYDILKKYFEEEYLNDRHVWRRRILSFSIEHNFNSEYRQKINNLMSEFCYTKVKELDVDDIYVHKMYECLVKS